LTIIMILNNKIKNQSGQSLIEIIIGLGIGTALIGAAVVAIIFMLRSGAVNQKFQIAAGLNREIADKIKTVVSANWNDLYNIYDINGNKDPNAQYHVDFSSGKFIFKNDATSTIIEGMDYASFFSVENVCRDDTINDIAGVMPCIGGSSEDPSTQKVTVYTRWPTGQSTTELKVPDYLTRWENAVFQQTDWSGGPANEPPVSEPSDKFSVSTNINFSSSGVIKIQGF